MGELGKKVFLNLAVPLTKYILSQLQTKAIAFVIDKFERKILGGVEPKKWEKIYFSHFERRYGLLEPRNY